MKKLLMICLALGMLLAAGLAQADQGQGERLVRQLWALMAARDIAKIEALTSPAFQSLQPLGAYNKAQELRRLKGMMLGSYTLSGFKVREQGPVIMVSYLVGAAEAKDGKPAQSKPARCLSIFINTDQGWRWLAQADLKQAE